MPGAPIAATTKTAILACDLFVLLWSKNAMASEWISQEIGIAHGNHKPILPFVLELGLSLPGFIKELRYVSAYQNPQQAMYSLTGNGAQELVSQTESASHRRARDWWACDLGITWDEQDFLNLQ